MWEQNGYVPRLPALSDLIKLTVLNTLARKIRREEATRQHDERILAEQGG